MSARSPRASFPAVRVNAWALRVSPRAVRIAGAQATAKSSSGRTVERFIAPRLACSAQTPASGRANITSDPSDAVSEASDVLSDRSDAVSETSDVTLHLSDAMSETSDVTLHPFDAVSEASDVTSDESDAVSETSDILSDRSDAVSERSVSLVG
jgi:methyl-accepting chemotaxis protein